MIMPCKSISFYLHSGVIDTLKILRVKLCLVLANSWHPILNHLLQYIFIALTKIQSSCATIRVRALKYCEGCNSLGHWWDDREHHIEFILIELHSIIVKPVNLFPSILLVLQ